MNHNLRPTKSLVPAVIRWLALIGFTALGTAIILIVLFNNFILIK